MTTVIRRPESIHQAHGRVQKGAFQGRWHFSFDDYFDPDFMSFGPLRVFNDDTLSPGAIWPLHPHREIEVVTYCAEGEFRHADERGEGGILQKGWVQHTTGGKGMWHAEINNRPDVPMRFIQMWFQPNSRDLPPSVEQMKVETSERTNRLLPLVSNAHPGALQIHSPGRVFSCFLQADHAVSHQLEAGWGAYLYLLEGGPVEVNSEGLSVYGSAIIKHQAGIDIAARTDSELLMVEVEI